MESIIRNRKDYNYRSFGKDLKLVGKNMDQLVQILDKLIRTERSYFLDEFVYYITKSLQIKLIDIALLLPVIDTDFIRKLVMCGAPITLDPDLDQYAKLISIKCSDEIIIGYNTMNSYYLAKRYPSIFKIKDHNFIVSPNRELFLNQVSIYFIPDLSKIIVDYLYH